MTENVTQLTTRFTAAADLARNLHAADVRKDTMVPYLSHLLAVAAIVLEHGGSEDQAIAGLLHDAAEDHGGQKRIDSIRAQFGDAVADIVTACSDSLVEEGTAKAPWWDRKVAYLDQLTVEPVEAALVSAADKLHNSRAILADYRRSGDALWGKFNADAGRTGSLWYYTRLVEILGERLAGSTNGLVLAAELRRTVGEIRACASELGNDLDTEDAAGRAREDATRRRLTLR
jgi:(p)ppGpp synthase/HD superfamily hydrolase